MNHCTELDEVLCERVPRQPLEPCWISKVKVTWVFCVLRLPADSWTCTLTTSRSLLIIKAKGQGHMGFCGFFCVLDTAAACRQYLALSKAW